ncbi:MAG: hypothetical protein AB1646_24060 [Thermodesulfobacteriota bacterium]
MWIIAVLPNILFALIFLFVFAQIAKTRRMRSVFYFLGVAVFSAAALLTAILREFDASDAIGGFFFFSLAFSYLIAIPILRRPVTPPCVRVKRLEQPAIPIIAPILGIASLIHLLVFPGKSLC